MVAASKHAAGDAQTRRTLRWAAITLASFCFGISMVVPTRASLLLNAVSGDAQTAGTIMSRNTSIAAALEFLLNPIVGQLSDTYGRKPFLVLSCLVTALMHGSVAVAPANLAANVLDRIVTATSITSVFTLVFTMLSDKVSGNVLAKASATNTSAMGLGMFLGPIVGGYLGPRPSFVVSTLCIGLSLQSMGDFNAIYDITIMLLRSHLGWTEAAIGRFWAFDGLAQVAAGSMASMTITALGPTLHTTVANLAFAAGVTLLGAAGGEWGVGAGLLVKQVGCGRQAVVNAAITARGQAAGLGRGEISAALANWSAVLKVASPLVLGSIFRWATADPRNSRAYAPFMVVGALHVLADVLHRRVAGKGA